MVKASLPGIKPDDVQYKVHGDTLTIRGGAKVEEEKKGEHWHIRERRSGVFQRSLTLSTPVGSRRGPGRVRARRSRADLAQVGGRKTPADQGRRFGSGPGRAAEGPEVRWEFLTQATMTKGARPGRSSVARLSHRGAVGSAPPNLSRMERVNPGRTGRRLQDAHRFSSGPSIGRIRPPAFPLSLPAFERTERTRFGTVAGCRLLEDQDEVVAMDDLAVERPAEGSPGLVGVQAADGTGVEGGVIG